MRYRLRPNLQIDQGTAEALPNPDRGFDVVITTDSFHHWSDKSAALAAVFRVLRWGGVFALADVSLDDLPARPRALWALARQRMSDMPTLDSGIAFSRPPDFACSTCHRHSTAGGSR